MLNESEFYDNIARLFRFTLRQLATRENLSDAQYLSRHSDAEILAQPDVIDTFMELPAYLRAGIIAAARLRAIEVFAPRSTTTTFVAFAEDRERE